MGRDVAAGVTVAALAVPQGLAYALVAGVPPEMGLYAAALPAIVAALFGSSPHLVTGPTNPVALVIGVSIVAPAVASGHAVPVAAVLATGGLAGAMLVAFGLAGLGRAARFLSDSVIAGFATGAGLLIAIRQIPALAGSPTPVRAPHPLAPQAFGLVADAWSALATAEPSALAVALAVPLVVLALRRVDRRIPGALLALAGASLWGDAQGGGLATLGSLPAGLPPLRLPGLVPLQTIAAPAFAIALISTLQSVAAARTLRGSSEPRFDPERELVAQGAGNLMAACAGALPTSGSFTRSALARAAGGRSRLAPLVSGLTIVLLLPWGAPLLERVPIAALAGLVVMSGLDLINLRALRRAASTRGDALVLGATLVAMMWIGLLEALYAGIFLSLALLVIRSGRLQMVELVRAPNQRFREIPLDPGTGRSPAVLLHLEGDLNFAVAPPLADRLREIAARGPRVVVLRLKRALYLDSTVLEVLREVALELQARGARLVICGLTDPLAEVLESSELAGILGAEGLLRSGDRLFEGFERALDRCRELVAPLSDDQIFRTEASAPWTLES
ncbi:MAG: SulP family inorganic anion transporter [Myxococcota bacterium]